MTLGAFAANEQLWTTFEVDWNEILHSYSPRAEYIHMKEVNTLTKEFDWRKGWTANKAFALVTKCLSYMSHVDKTQFRMFYCSVDLEAWIKVKNEGIGVPDPVEICSDFAMYGVLSWYAKQKSPEEVFHIPADSAHYFFDKDEPFEPKFREKWRSEVARHEDTGIFNPWVLVEQSFERGYETNSRRPGCRCTSVGCQSRKNRNHRAGRTIVCRHHAAGNPIYFDNLRREGIAKSLWMIRYRSVWHENGHQYLCPSWIKSLILTA